MNKLLKEIWNQFIILSWEGKKRTFGAIIMGISIFLQAFFPTLLNETQYHFFEWLGTILYGIGWAHKGYRYYKDKNTKIDNIN